MYFFLIWKHDQTNVFVNTVCQQAISKFESLVNQIQKNAKDINSRLEMIQNTVLFKHPPPKIGGMLPDAKVIRSTVILISNDWLKQKQIILEWQLPR